MEIKLKKKKKKKRGFEEGPPADKMLHNNKDRAFVITK